jgi:signal peptidase I
MHHASCIIMPTESVKEKMLFTTAIALSCIADSLSFSASTFSGVSSWRRIPAQNDGRNLWRRTSPFLAQVSSEETLGLKDSLTLYPLQDQFFNVTLPSYSNLMSLSRGQYVASAPFSATGPDKTTHRFRVLVYPRGGGHMTKNKPLLGKNQKEEDETSGFGMSYKVLPLFGKTEERVGFYLQFLPSQSEETVDATFSLRLIGNQKVGRKFDVEWSAGMRFQQDGKLQEGTASDFGAHLMQTQLLSGFMGVDDQDLDPALSAQVRLNIHIRKNISVAAKVETRNETNESFFSGMGILPFQDIRQVTSNGQVAADVHDTDMVRVGKIVVPILRRLNERPRLFEQGTYPGVEYRILRIFSQDGFEIFGSEPNAEYELKPIYPLVDQLERPWPVRVKEKDIPKLYTATMYNTISAIGSLLTAVSGLALAFVVSQLISLFVIPSRSMDPTLQVGDVLVVEKLSPRIFKSNNQKEDVVLFHPPSELQKIVSSSGGRIADRDLFVKRVAAEPGDIVKTTRSGDVTVNGEKPADRRDLCEAEPLKLIERYIKPGEIEVKKNEVFVLGDCSSVSIDSRVWGPLSDDEIVGKPLFRVWPLGRFGSVSRLTIDTPSEIK